MWYVYNVIIFVDDNWDSVKLSFIVFTVNYILGQQLGYAVTLNTGDILV